MTHEIPSETKFWLPTNGGTCIVLQEFTNFQGKAPCRYGNRPSCLVCDNSVAYYQQIKAESNLYMLNIPILDPSCPAISRQKIS